MKICFITGFIYQGGAHRWIIELARDAALRGHDVTLLVDFPTDEPDYFGRLPESVRLWYVSPRRWTEDGPPTGWRWHLRRSPAIAWFVWKNRRRLLEFDVVHVMATRLLPLLYLWLRLLLRANKPRFIETFTSYFEGPESVGQNRMLRLFWQHIDALPTGVDSPARQSVAARLPHVRMPLIMFGVARPEVETVADVDRRAYRQAAGVPDTARWVVGSVQRLHPSRRPWELIDAYVEIAKQLGDDVHFIHAGDGPAREMVEARAIAGGIGDQMHFLGGVAEVKYPFSIIDLHVIQAGYGLPGAAGFEAALAGVPNVGIDFRPSPYERRPTDFLWSDPDPRAIAEHVVMLLRDDDERRRVAERQRRDAERIASLDACGRAYDALYHDIARSTGLVADAELLVGSGGPSTASGVP